MMGRWGGAVALVVAFLIAGGLHAIQPQAEGNIWHTAVAPATADAGSFRVTVADPQRDVAIVGAVSVGFREYRSDARLVLVEARYEFVRPDTVINDVRLVSADGYSYQYLSEYSIAHSKLQPGFQADNLLIFEAPEDKLDGATLEFCRSTIISQRHHCARIEGAITAETPRHTEGTANVDPKLPEYEVIPR